MSSLTLQLSQKISRQLADFHLAWVALNKLKCPYHLTLIYIYFIVILCTWVKFEKTPSTKLRGSTASVFYRFYIKKRIGVLASHRKQM